ncbi:MAG TPA: ribosomal protein S18-alanine N-acetyltransferase [Geobacteraceae bacterium]
MAIRPMTEDDLEAVQAIERASFPRPWNREHFLDELKSPHAFPLAAVAGDGTVIGYIFPRLLLDEGEILNVAVARACCGRGVGRRLVQRAIADCRKGGAVFVSLEVRCSNTAAISLYRRLGFTETGRRRRYYENGEDAILMDYHFTVNGGDDAI